MALFSDGFETDYTPWSFNQHGTNGTIGTDTTTKHVGAKSSKHVLSADYDYSRAVKTGFNAAALYDRIYFYTDALPDTNKHFEILRWDNSGWSNIVGLRVVDVSGVKGVQVNNAIASETYTANFAFANSAWYCLDLWVQIGAATGACKVWVNGGSALIDQSSKNFGTSNLDVLHVGQLFGYAGTVYIDDVVVDSSYIGPLASGWTHKFLGVPNANIGKINSILKANIGKVDGV